MIKMSIEKAYCPVCMYETIIRTGTKASDYFCPRHCVRCIYSGEQTNLHWIG